MRWRFIDPNNRAEADERAAVLTKIDAWWRALQCQTGALAALFAQKAKWDVPGWMEQHLQTIDPRLLWEYGPAVRGVGASARDHAGVVSHVGSLVPPFQGLNEGAAGYPGLRCAPPWAISCGPFGA